jgi:hypothetical protein
MNQKPDKTEMSCKKIKQPLFNLMRAIRFTLLFLFLLLVGFPDSQAQDARELYRVVLVKGKPKRQGNKSLQDGQKMLEKEKVLFTSLQDVVILINEHFDRIYLKPKGKTDLNKLKAVVEFVPRVPQSAERSIVAQTRGIEKTRNIQSLSDTFRIDLSTLQNIHPGLKVSDFYLSNGYMDEVKSSFRLEGNILELTFPKTGLFILYCKESSRSLEVLAEIEYLAKDEVLAELRYVAQSAASSDSVLREQIRYMNRVYPHLSNEQITLALNKK